MSGGVVSFWIDATNSPQVVDAGHPFPVAITGPVVGPINVQGTVANGAAGTPNPVVTGMQSGANVVSMATALNANGSSGTGVLAAGALAKYNATPPTFVDQNYGNHQIDFRGNLRVSLVTANGGSAVALVNVGDGSTIAGAVPTQSGTMAFNGTTSDQVRGSAADSLIQKPYALRTNDLQNTQAIAAAGTTAVFAAAGAGFKNFMTALQISSVLASVATTVQIKDGATVIWSIDIPAGASSIDKPFPTPLQGSANTTMNVTTSAAGPISFNAQGYKG